MAGQKVEVPGWRIPVGLVKRGRWRVLGGQQVPERELLLQVWEQEFGPFLVCVRLLVVEGAVPE
jgi:hypothetical protein